MSFSNYSQLYTSNNDSFMSKDEQFYVVDKVSESIDIICYKNMSENNVVDKTLIEEFRTIGVFRDEFSITSPTITLELASIPTFNYVYIPSLKRYYYVTGFTVVNSKLFTLELNVDVLMSFKNEILSQNAFVKRCEAVYNEYIPDANLMCENNIEVEVIEGDKFLDSTYQGYQYVLSGAVSVIQEGVV